LKIFQGKTKVAEASRYDDLMLSEIKELVDQRKAGMENKPADQA
jgi:plasmid stabilization system protein ParE